MLITCNKVVLEHGNYLVQSVDGMNSLYVNISLANYGLAPERLFYKPKCSFTICDLAGVPSGAGKEIFTDKHLWTSCSAGSGENLEWHGR